MVQKKDRNFERQQPLEPGSTQEASITLNTEWFSARMASADAAMLPAVGPCGGEIPNNVGSLGIRDETASIRPVVLGEILLYDRLYMSSPLGHSK
jgi:hypothetical protein